MDTAQREQLWNERYRASGASDVSWYEATPELSLGLINRVSAPETRSVIDVGGGASALAEHLTSQGESTDVAVLDVSATALDHARNRMRDPGKVTWIRADVLEWTPSRQWQVWHDRAVFHFLTVPVDRETYRHRMLTALEPGGAAIIFTFALDGPDSCSGLPVARYAADGLLEQLGDEFTIIDKGRHEHHTPTGSTQPFTWVAARHRARGCGWRG